jgi:hypothetical protein
MQIHEEWHITVAGATADDVLRWRATCASLGVKALWIELSTFERQLMCASSYNCAQAITARGWEIIRVKHEMQPTRLDVSTFEKPNTFLDVPQQYVYHECHVKLDGIFRANFPMASRDLLREHRWYATFRQVAPFDPSDFLDRITRWALIPDGWRGVSSVAGYEYEAAILDTNPNLDQHWSANGR